MTTLQYGDTAGMETSKRIAAATATQATLVAVGPAERSHGQVCLTLDLLKLWVYDALSTTTAGATVLVPAVGPGRWKLLAAVV